MNLQYSTEQITNKVGTKMNLTAAKLSGNNLKKKEIPAKEF